MKILAIDTTSESAGIALRIGNSIREKSFSASGNHGQNLFPAVQDLLHDSDTAIHSIDRFGCCVGPGSYTGIRISVTACAVMSRLCDRKVASVPSLEAIAWAASSEFSAAVYAPLISAGNQICFHGAYTVEPHGLLCVSDPKRLRIDEIQEATPPDALFVALTPEKWHPDGTVFLPDRKKNIATAIAEITSVLPPDRLVGHEDLCPVYLRDATVTSRKKGIRPNGK